MQITEEEIDSVMSERSGFRRSVLEFWGVPWDLIKGSKDTCLPVQQSAHQKDARIALLEYAVLCIADEASREGATWKSLRRCVIAQAHASLEPSLWDDLERAIRQRIRKS